MEEEISDFEQLVQSVREALGDESIEFGVFRTASSEHASLRRVVWIPGAFSCEPVLQTSAVYDPRTGQSTETLHVDHLTVECHITGRNFADACGIRRQVLSAVNAVFRTSSTASDGAYQTEAEGSSGVMWGGNSRVVQRFVWMLNVIKTPELPLARINEIDLCDVTQVPASPPALRLEQELVIKTQV